MRQHSAGQGPLKIREDNYVKENMSDDSERCDETFEL